MNGIRLDRLPRFFTTQRARRAAEIKAQEATPEADPLSAANKTEYLFVQSFEGGTIAPKEGEADTYTLTLQHGLGQTVYFGDRPNRDVGATSTPDFLQALGFSQDNPPNAAFVVDDGKGGTDIVVVELYNPLYDPVSPGVTYDVKVLQNWEQSLEMGFAEAPADLDRISSDFGNAHLFIDDCGSYDVYCHDSYVGHCVDPIKGVPYCWSGDVVACVPCEGWDPFHAFDFDKLKAYWTNKCVNQSGCTPGFCEATDLTWYDKVGICHS